MTTMSQSQSPQAPAPEPPPVVPPAPATARYRVTFDATWSAATHPVDWPDSAHWSPLVGGTHDSTVTFWQEGGTATLGIRDVAERGLTFRLEGEIGAAIGRGAEASFTGGNIGRSPGSASVEFNISQRYPLVTLVSMVAPSPDWFVGVAGLPLFESNQWVSSKRVELVPWDAGTDCGATFTSPDCPRTPQIPISRIVTAPLSPNGMVRSLGTFTFERLQ